MRPEFHFTARRGWINDPHGIVARDGGYDFFYQHVPGSTSWQPNCHWGHARSDDDLVTFRERGIAIAPGDGEDGIWTGALAVNDAGAARILYTAISQPDVAIGRVRVATPDDDAWDRWTKGAVVADAPDHLDIVAYRDPFVRREPDGTWRMFLGAGARDGTAMALSYTSPDLDAWGYEGIALQRSTREREPVWMGTLWECPQFFHVDGRDVMVSSVWDADTLHYAGYALGRYADGRFEAESWGRLTYGASYYAPSSFRDAAGRPCLMFWMRGVEDAVGGWAGALSVPHVLGIDGDRLTAEPHPDLTGYHRTPAEGRMVAGTAADVRWAPVVGEEFRVRSGGSTVLIVRTGAHDVRVSSGAGEESAPWAGESIRIVLDAQAAEISSPAGILGFAIAPAGDSLEFSGTHLEIHALGRA
jgi:beta-fructofuranosidase